MKLEKVAAPLTAPCKKELSFVFFLIEKEKMRLFLNSVKPLSSPQPNLWTSQSCFFVVVVLSSN